MKHSVYIIVATDQKLGIGKDNDMPWRLKKELAHFQRITTEVRDPSKQNMVIMGRKTWESLPPSSRPLKNRKNIIITRDIEYQAPQAVITNSIPSALNLADETIESIFIIGGGSIYKQAIELKEINGIYQTEIEATFECDTFFPAIPDDFNRKISLGSDNEKDLTFTYYLHTKN